MQNNSFQALSEAEIHICTYMYIYIPHNDAFNDADEDEIDTILMMMMMTMMMIYR